MSEAFLSRWSRLKRVPQEQAPGSEQADPQAVIEDQIPSLKPESAVMDLASSDATVLDAVADQSITEHEHEHEPGSSSGSDKDSEPAPLTDDDMPPLESINARSDVSMFFSSAVSPELRSKALKKLFHQPEFNVRDPLDEYADDYSNMPLLDRKVAATLKGWVGKQVREALLAEENAAAEQADSLMQHGVPQAVQQIEPQAAPQAAQQPSQQAVQDSAERTVPELAAEDSAEQTQSSGRVEAARDQSLDPEFPNDEESKQTK